MTDKIGYIYIIENNFDNNVYIGLTTKTPDKRFIEHKHKAKTTPCSAFHKFMALKGIENFNVKTLKTLHYKYIVELQLAEEECIRDLGTLNTVHNVNSPVKVDSELITLNKVANS